MSESDDSDILADIKALDEALALTNDDRPRSRHDSSSSTDIGSSDDSDNEFIDSNQDVDESLNAYEINKRLLKGLMIAKKQLTSVLRECEQKIKKLDEKMDLADESTDRIRLLLTTAGMPYFKDKDGFSMAPKNNDTKLKEACGELFLPNLAKPCRWSGKDREMLMRSVQNEAIESVLSGDFSKDMNEEASKENSTSEDQPNKTVTLFPKTFTEMVGPLGKKEFDWFKIAFTDFDDKHSPGECRSMWNVYLHPDIEKSEWTSAEDKVLLRCAKECKYQDWDTITAKLGTKRSAYQCFIRYNTIKKWPTSGHPWTKQEDKHLVLVLNKLRIGSYIPWSEITIYLQHRAKQQVYTRWTYRKAPHLIKGRFTCLETDTLMKAVKKYGPNFPKISSIVMPYRTSMQLNEHYNTMTNKRGNIWTLDDDKKLSHLHAKHGNKWSKIAKYFTFKSRTQVRHRYKAILRYVMRGITLEKIPRQSASTNSKRTKNTNASQSRESKRLLQQVSLLSRDNDLLPRLFEALSFPPSTKNIYSQELYDSTRLTHDTRQLYDILTLLDADLNVPNDFFNYAHISRREKDLLNSLRRYISTRDQCTENNVVEEFRSRMFGPIPQISANSRFIPPLPFNGYIKTKNLKKSESINCDLDPSQKFLIDVPTEMVIPRDVSSFLDAKEENQFFKISQLLISDSYNCSIQNANLQRKRHRLSFDNKDIQPLSKRNKLNINSKAECKTETGQSDMIHGTNIATHVNAGNEETDITTNIIVPNYTSLLGLKNLLLWKLLYEYQNESYLTSQNIAQPEETERSPEYERAHRTLRTRLLQLFKLPICLSNIILRINNSDGIFLTEKQTEQKKALKCKEQKFEDVNSTQQNESSKLNVLADSNIQQNVEIEKKGPETKSAELPKIRSSKMILTKYKVVAKFHS